MSSKTTALILGLCFAIWIFLYVFSGTWLTFFGMIIMGILFQYYIIEYNNSKNMEEMEDE